MEDEVKRSKLPQIVGKTIEKHKEYFEDRIEARLSRGHSFSGNQIDEAFFDIIIDDEDDDGQVLEWVKEEVQNDQTLTFGCSQNLQQFLSTLLLQCVEKEKSVALKKVLEWFQAEIAPLNQVTHLLLDWDWDRPVHSSNFIPKWNGLTGNSQAMIRACEKDDFEMVSTFLNFKYPLRDDLEATFRIDDSEFKACEQDDKDKWKNHSRLQNNLSFILTRRHFLNEDKDILLHYRNFFAVSRPAYLIAKAKQENKYKKFDRLGLTPYDPISEAFHNVHVSRVQARRNVEYRNKFNIVKNKSKEFIVKMLDCCENSEEAQLFLLHDYKIDHYFTDALINEMPYPRLEIAVADKHEEFVGHDYCQQILTQAWLRSDATGDIIQWQSSNMTVKMLYCLSCFIMYPVHILAYIPVMVMGGYPKREDRLKQTLIQEGQPNDKEPSLCCGLNFLRQSYLHLSFPINRYIANTISYLILLILLIYSSEDPWDEDKSIDLDWYDVCIPIWSLGFLCFEIKQFRKRYKGKNFSFWNFYNIVLYLILLVSRATIGIGYLDRCNSIEEEKAMKALVKASCTLWQCPLNLFKNLNKCTADRPDEHGPYSAVVIGYSFFGIGITMGFVRLMYFCQMVPTIGPIVISIKKIIKDILLVTVTHLIFLFAFGLGIYSVMRVTDDSVCKTNESHSFHDLIDSSKSLFWNLFDPGKIEQLGCSDIPQRAPRKVGMFLFGAYLLFNVIILLNALVAIMNSTLNVVNMDKVNQWKFARTTMWLKHFDSNYVLPCPFNLLEYLHFSIIYIFKSCFCKNNQQAKRWMDSWDTDR